jgi:hypothetical protein
VSHTLDDADLVAEDVATTQALAYHLIVASFFRSTRLIHSRNSLIPVLQFDLKKIAIGDHHPKSGVFAFLERLKTGIAGP